MITYHYKYFGRLVEKNPEYGCVHKFIVTWTYTRKIVENNLFNKLAQWDYKNKLQNLHFSKSGAFR